jgi:lipoprotein-releasing system permease protein
MSLTALIGLSLGTAAMTLVLSAFAGLEDLVGSQFEHSNPALKISPASGQFLELTAEDSTFIANEAAHYPASVFEPIYEQRVLLVRENYQVIADLLGTSDEYIREHHIEDYVLTLAEPKFLRDSSAIRIGSEVSKKLGISNTNPPPRITVYLPKINSATNVLNPNQAAVDSCKAWVVSVHTLQPDYDRKVIASSSWVKEFTGAKHPSYLEVYSDDDDLRKSIEDHFSDRVVVADRLEQEITTYKLLRSERLVVIAILAFVVLLASFGVVSALTIIALEKDNDIRTLWSMGASNGQLRRLFFTNGMYIVGAGWALGMVIALILIFLQQQFKLISWGPEVDQFYPVKIEPSNVLLTTAIVLSIGIIMSAWSTRNVVRN